MCAAPFVFLVAAVILCFSPLAIPFIPVLLWYWYREKRAGRELDFRSWFGNPADAELATEAQPIAASESRRVREVVPEAEALPAFAAE